MLSFASRLSGSDETVPVSAEYVGICALGSRSYGGSVITHDLNTQLFILRSLQTTASTKCQPPFHYKNLTIRGEMLLGKRFHLSGTSV